MKIVPAALAESFVAFAPDAKFGLAVLYPYVAPVTTLGQLFGKALEHRQQASLPRTNRHAMEKACPVDSTLRCGDASLLQLDRVTGADRKRCSKYHQIGRGEKLLRMGARSDRKRLFRLGISMTGGAACICFCRGEILDMRGAAAGLISTVRSSRKQKL
jgi:hypothetical protein